MILQRINGFALCHLLPPLVWQAVFFVGPLLFLLALTFWSVQSYRLELATLSNTGPGLGEMGPAASYAQLTPLQTALCAFSMLIGRLELLSFIIMMRRSFWVY